MKRVIYLLIVMLHRIPGLLLKIRYFKKNMTTTTLQERFGYVQNLIKLINKKARVRMHVYGKENLPEKQGYLMAPNHQGMFDALILVDTHDKPFKTIYKKELQETIVVNDLLDIMEHLPIDRENLRASMKVIREVTNQLKEGISFVIFPEGTRCKQQNKMLEFKGGTFKSAIDAKAPIVPVALIDCYRVFDDNTMAYVDAQIHYLQPLYYEDYQEMSSQQIAELVQSRIQECIDKNENNFK